MSTPQNFSSIPVIDISALFGNDDRDKRRVAAELGAAARDVGFLYIRGHGIDDALFERLIDAAKRFFAQPVEKKMEVYIGHSKNHRGYVPEGEEVFASGSKDKKEAYDLSADLPATDADYLAGNPLLGPNQWPDCPGFREAVGTYYDAVFKLGRTLMQGFALALGEAPDVFDRHLTKPPSQLRLIHYPFDASAEDRMGIGAHTDYECFTLLKSTSSGLEVMNGAGEWIDAPPVPGAFIVNIGDMLEIMTNGHFVATSHRVRKVKEERYSFPLFFSLDYHTEVRPLDRFVSAQRPAKPSLVAGEHLFAQTAQTFSYQKARLARGEIALPTNTVGLSSFGRDTAVSA
ncbi:2OG-Fe(II) oxygenase [Afipia sp. P52-10]|uniref:isopenicillin N synthase family dioxygenase n=1 Tax=Afipia sp. P52-10 TaxID=1429916 RepID=UPI0003DF2591|nr:2-oxoglutarate and iron-dependent oxygenase domain-containing protein [Afipia sp. P52-10]ETR78184.1 2OG-Fe(II) oxygenase [Afipia sp. P52-10]